MNEEDLVALIAGKQKLPILVVTIAAESVTPDQVRALVGGGIKVSIGHCNAGFDAVKALIDAGASMITHLFNAMSPLTSREPGMVGAALDSAHVYAGLIADSHHVKPATMNIALRAKKGPGQIFLISDAMSPVGTDVKELVLNDRRIVRENGKLLLEDGTLAGADLEMASAVRVLSRQTDATLEEALRMASLYPAQAVGLSGAGRLAIGLQANFVHLNDNIEQQATWIAGEQTK
jgi:N-acetylglucosamine-6-phosphate deacetylase